MVPQLVIFYFQVALLEPIWEKGCPRVGEEGAIGWELELNRINQMDNLQPVTEDTDWEDDILVDHGDRLVRRHFSRS